VCHNVLEFIPERAEIVKEFSRVLRRGGTLSIVKNNGAGRIMQKVIFQNNINEALNLLNGGNIANTFGKVDLYNSEELIVWADDLRIKKILGMRTFCGMQPNKNVKHEPEWYDKMFEIEMKVSDMEPYKSISLFHHVLLIKQ